MVNVFFFLISFFTTTGMLNANFYVKVFAFEFILAFITILYAFKKRNRHCTQNVTYISLADLFITLILCAYLYHGIGTHNILDTFWPLAYFLFYYFLRLNGTTDPSGQWTHIAPWVISAHLLLCVFQYFSWIPNHNSLFTIGSTFGNPDMLSTYLASLLPCCYLTPKKKTYRLGLLALTLLLFVLLQARTALIASILTIVFYAAAQFKLPLKTLLACSLFLGILIVLLALWHPESLLGRFYIWMVCCHLLAKNPFGWGTCAFERYYPEEQSLFTMTHPELASTLNYDIVHSPFNEFLNVGVGLGLLPLCLYIAFTVYVLIKAHRIHSKLFYPLLTFQILSCSYFPFRVIPVAAIYILFCGMVLNQTEKKAMGIKIPIGISKGVTVCFSLVLWLGASISTYSYLCWEKGLASGKQGTEIAASRKHFEKAYPWLNGNGRFLVSYAEWNHQNENKEKAYGLMHQGERYFCDISFLHNLAMVYEDEGKLNEANRVLELGIHMSPKNIKMRFAQVLFYQRIGKTEKAYQDALVLLEDIKRTEKTPNPQIQQITYELEKFVGEYKNRL